MSLVITSITILTPQLQNMLAFYRVIGFDFATQNVDKGTKVYRALHNSVEFSLYESSQAGKSPTPCLQLGFKVSDLDSAFSGLISVVGSHPILDPTDMPDGKKAIVLDPDGNSIELTEI